MSNQIEREWWWHADVYDPHRKRPKPKPIDAMLDDPAVASTAHTTTHIYSEPDLDEIKRTAPWPAKLLIWLAEKIWSRHAR